MSSIHYHNQQCPLLQGKTLFDYADELKVKVPTSCGRNGQCHECIVEVLRGGDSLNSPTKAEVFLSGDYRLACQATVLDTDSDVEFSILQREPKILTHSIHHDFPICPLTHRQGNTVFFDNHKLDQYRGYLHGLAIDIGTTTVAINLADLASGEILWTTSFENPQRFGGSDIMNRISYDGGDFHGELQKAILSTVNTEITAMSRQANLSYRTIYEVVVVGNSTMRDIFFGINVQPIGERPYKSTTQLELESGRREATVIETSGKNLGLRVFPDARVYGGPLIGCHIGADVAADLLAVGMDELENVVAVVDVGTNTEVVVGNRHRMMACSCPAGPAFEGGHILHGMPGYKGAIESVEIDKEGVHYKTIGQVQAQGICGSGLVDLLAELRRTGQMSPLGVFEDGSMEFSFAPEKSMSISRSDVSALAQAKSANYAGQFIVLREYGLPLNEISDLYLAGGFANYVNVRNAREIGFIANLPLEKITKVGNASLEGATMILLSREKRHNLERLVKNIEHIELETTADFFEIFVEGCLFNPMQLDL